MFKKFVSRSLQNNLLKSIAFNLTFIPRLCSPEVSSDLVIFSEFELYFRAAVRTVGHTGCYRQNRRRLRHHNILFRDATFGGRHDNAYVTDQRERRARSTTTVSRDVITSHLPDRLGTSRKKQTFLAVTIVHGRRR